MNSKQLWQTFLETGSPEVYLLYNHAKRMEEDHVCNGAGVSPSCHAI